jgi:hypothetical protein
MATLAVFTANITCINALVDISTTRNTTAFLVRSLQWVACMRVPGNTPDTCEYAAQHILNLWRAASADILISLLGTEYFLLESSRLYNPLLASLFLVSMTNPAVREWWTGWRDAFVSWYQWVREHLKTRRIRQNSAATDASVQVTSMKSTGLSSDDELKGVQLHPVSLVTDFNPKASKAGV